MKTPILLEEPLSANLESSDSTLLSCFGTLLLMYLHTILCHDSTGGLLSWG
jgi:hypothetical protein